MRTGHGVDVDLLTAVRLGVSEAAALLRRHDLRRFDALILVLQPPRSAAGLSALRGRLQHLLADLSRRLPPSATIMVALPPPTEERSFRLAGPEPRYRAFREIVATASRSLAATVDLAAFPTSPVVPYPIWCTAIAAHLARRLRDPNRWRPSADPTDEVARQGAVMRLPLSHEDWEAEFMGVLSSARDAYGTRFASIGLVDGDLTRFVVRSGFDTLEFPRETTLCNTALVSRSGLVVGDAGEDRRFRLCAGIRGGPVRFYAGYRIEGADGQPVAVLCVFDPLPRVVTERDVTMLRDFAHGVQRRLWDLAHPYRP